MYDDGYLRRSHENVHHGSGAVHWSTLTTTALNNRVTTCFGFLSSVCIRHSVYLYFNGASPALLLLFQAFNLSQILFQ